MDLNSRLINKNLDRLIKKVLEEKGDEIKKRLNEFKKNDLFKELCYCILTANFNAERSIKIQKEIGDGFYKLSEKELAKKLKELGHRFPNTRAKYIVEARKHNLKEILKLDPEKAREYLVKNVKGLGMKEASHFLRNIGYTQFAIIDFHILDLLERFKVIKRPKTLTKKKYLEIEEKLRKICKNLAKLDLILWYIETGRILK